MLHFIFEMEQRRLRLGTESKKKYSQCLLVKLGLLGPERVTRLMPPFRRSGGLLVKIGILGPKNYSGSIESEIAESFGELPARLLGLAKYRLRRSRQLTLLQS